jgi:beta-glucosidase
MYYNFKPSAQINEYLSMDNKPLWYFGYGLSYTRFSQTDLRLEKNKIKKDGSTKVKVDITNTGKREGDEIVQMYIRDKVSSVTRPVKELKGFKRVSLKPGDTKTVTFEINPDLLAFHDINMNFVVEPGEFEIMVGNSSRDEDLQKVVLKVI